MAEEAGPAERISSRKRDRSADRRAEEIFSDVSFADLGLDVKLVEALKSGMPSPGH